MMNYDNAYALGQAAALTDKVLGHSSSNFLLNAKWSPAVALSNVLFKFSVVAHPTMAQEDRMSEILAKVECDAFYGEDKRPMTDEESCAMWLGYRKEKGV